jgi:hypothetical protein
MAKAKLSRLILTAVIDVSFEAFHKKADNDAAKRQIEMWVLDALRSECGHIPLYIEMRSGNVVETVECCTKQSEVRLIRPRKRRKK